MLILINRHPYSKPVKVYYKNGNKYILYMTYREYYNYMWNRVYLEVVDLYSKQIYIKTENEIKKRWSEL